MCTMCTQEALEIIKGYHLELELPTAPYGTKEQTWVLCKINKSDLNCRDISLTLFLSLINGKIKFIKELF